MDAYVLELKLLVLLLIANGSPVLAARLCGPYLGGAIDRGMMFLGRPLFGSSKTWRGIIVALGFTTLFALVLGLNALVGIVIGLGAMLGDVMASFIKRRLNIPSSGMSLGLDQIPESLLPLLLVKSRLELGWPDIALIVAVFFILELLLSAIGYRLRLRKRPY
ncbi:MAG: CDP-archaeol synthase [Gammaproteobacteria bacterium]|nr:CDP-archaeol synthase [Gammaproteobacteria bacterium]